MKKYYVYIWYIDETKEVFYVGKGTGNRVTSMKNRNPHFKNVRKKYKCSYEIVKYFDNEDEAYAYELKLGNEYKAKEQAWCCYVLGKADKFISKETRDKISARLKGVKVKRKRILTDEHKEKLRQAHLGKKDSELTKKRKSIALTGHKDTKETKLKKSLALTGVKNPMFGKKQSEEHIHKRMEKMIGRKVSEETKAKIGLANGKKVAKINPKTNEIENVYNSVSEASITNGINSSGIFKCCRGERKTSGGFKWEYQ